jgi:hypothetical protein
MEMILRLLLATRSTLYSLFPGLRGLLIGTRFVSITHPKGLILGKALGIRPEA